MGRHTEVVARASRIREAANALILRELERHGVKGLVPSHGSLLCLLYAETDVSMCVLAERLHRTRPTVTVLVDKLVALGYVTREQDPGDRRVTWVRLTDAGRALLPVFEAVSAALDGAVRRGLSDAEAATLEELLRCVQENLEA